MRSGVLLLALLLVGCAANTRNVTAENDGFYPADIPRKEKGDFIFFSNQVFSDPAMFDLYFDYIKKFRVCLTNGYTNFQGDQLRELHEAGCELFIYRWFNGYYVDELAFEGADASYYGMFPEMIEGFRNIHKNPDWLINPDEPMQGSGAVKPAYFFDYNNPEFRAFYVNWIVADLDRADYDGVFFDYIGGWALPASVKARWNEKYPNKTYNQASIEFLAELDAALGERKIFGNQAYRMEPEFYDHMDYDVSESYAVSFVWGKETELYLEGEEMTGVIDTYYRLWDGVGGYEEISPKRVAAGKDPRIELFDINYLQPWLQPTGQTVAFGDKREDVYTRRTDRPAIYYGYVISKLTHGSSFASDWYATGYGRDDIYFLDLGEPVENDYRKLDQAIIRYFENGFVVATRQGAVVTIEPDESVFPAGVTGMWDLYEGVPVPGWERQKTVTVYPEYYPSTRSYYPSGRVFVYLKGQGE